MSDDDDQRREIVPRQPKSGDEPERSAFHREVDVAAQHAREEIDGRRLLSHDELNRAERQAQLGSRARAAEMALDQRATEHHEGMIRARIGTWRRAILVVFMVVLFVLAVATGVGPADLWRLVP